MPYTSKEKKLFAALIRQYGRKKGEQVYHGMARTPRHKKIFGAKTRRKAYGK